MFAHYIYTYNIPDFQTVLGKVLNNFKCPQNFIHIYMFAHYIYTYNIPDFETVLGKVQII